jgi:NitT/TauT family transport system substrate-binding protein
MNKKVLALLIVILAIIGSIIGWRVYRSRTNHRGNVVRVGYKPNSGYQHFFVAQDKGFFKNHQLEVEGVSFESTNQMVQAMVNGDIDATAASSIEVLALVQQNSPDLFKIYLTLVFDKDNAFHSLLVPANSKIQKLSDLKGKRIGTNPGSTSQSWLEIVLGHFFDAKKDVQIIQLEPRIQLQALSSGQVDALYTVDPLVTTSQTKGLARVLMKGPENEYMFTPMATGGGAVSQKFIQRNPDAAKKLISAFNDAVDFMRANETETRQIIGKDAKLESDVAAKLDLLRFWKLEETDMTAVQKYLDLLVQTKVLTKHVAAEDLYLNKSFK